MNLGSLSSLRSSKNTARLYQIRVIIHRCLVFLWGDPPKWKWVICHPCHLLVPGPKDWPSGRGGVENTYLRAKVQDAIGEVGSAVASGCVTTCGAAVFLLFCQIRIFTRFGQVLVVNMVCSLVFALLWIPAVLELRQKRAPGVDSDEGYAMGLLGEEGLRFCCPARLSKTGEIDAGVLTEPPVLVVFVMLATEPLQVLPSLVLLTVLSGPTSSRAFCCLIVRDILASMAETVTRAAIWVSPKRIAISVVAAGAISALLLVTAESGERRPIMRKETPLENVEGSKERPAQWGSIMRKEAREAPIPGKAARGLAMCVAFVFGALAIYSFGQQLRSAFQLLCQGFGLKDVKQK
eukprot:s121_g29.t1